MKTKNTKLHTIKQIEDILEVSRSTVNRLIKSGDLEKVKVRGGVRVTDESLRAYLLRIGVSAA